MYTGPAWIDEAEKQIEKLCTDDGLISCFNPPSYDFMYELVGTKAYDEATPITKGWWNANKQLHITNFVIAALRDFADFAQVSKWGLTEPSSFDAYAKACIFVFALQELVITAPVKCSIPATQLTIEWEALRSILHGAENNGFGGSNEITHKLVSYIQCLGVLLELTGYLSYHSNPVSLKYPEELVLTVKKTLHPNYEEVTI